MFRRLLAALCLCSGGRPTTSATGKSPELSASAIVAETVSGSHVLAVEGYSGTKRLGNGKGVTSRTFTVGGHRWSVAYYPNGRTPEAADWVAIFLQLQQGVVAAAAAADMDVIVGFTISLLDQDGVPVPSYSCHDNGTLRTFNSKMPSWGYAKFIERKVLEGSAYLRDDCFRVRVDIIVSKEIRTEDRDAAIGARRPSPPERGQTSC
ncbi:hypothetical protein ACP70R_007665 [Stipagrostis hirtigluma subsp. patula]